MAAGEIIRLRNYRHYTGAKLGIQNMDYTAPTGKVFLAFLMGIEDKDEGGDHLDPIWCLNDLGWYSGDQLAKVFTEEQLKEFGSKIDAERKANGR